MNTKKIVGISVGVVAFILVIILIITLVIPKIMPKKPVVDSKDKAENIISTALTDVKTAADYDSIFKEIENISSDDPTSYSDESAAGGGGADAGAALPLESADMEAATDSSKEAEPKLKSPKITASTLEEDESTEFSETNIQVEGVKEADVIKTDGDYIYAINSESLYIIEPNEGNPKLLSKTDSVVTGGQFYIEMYLSGDRVIALRNNDYRMTPYLYYDERDYSDEVKSITYIDVFDVKDPKKPTKIKTLSQSGNYKHSRMIDDYLYLVSEYYLDSETMKRGKPETFVPCYTNDSKESYAKPEDITIMPEKSYPNYSMISGIDTSNDIGFVSQKSILGDSYELYASLNTIYLTSTIYKEDVEKNKDGYKIFHSSQDSLITSIKIDKGNVKVKTSATIPGSILNQFSLDEQDGVLRAVTTVSKYTYFEYNEELGILGDIAAGLAEMDNTEEYSTVITLDEDLKVIGSIRDIAPNEVVYSCRFMGDIAYFVTFEQVDPLFSVDLSDPANPTIIGKLKIPGFSEYLHPYDEGLLFGLGRNADKDGNTDTLKLSMFDNSDPKNVTEKDKLVIKNVFYSEASYNHKAIVIDAKKNLIAFPSEEKYLIYSYDKKGGFKQEAEISLSNKGLQTYEYMRGMFIGDIFYVISSNSVNAYDMNKDYKKLGSVELPREEPLPLPDVTPLPRVEGDIELDVIE